MICYNHERYIGEAIESILSQTYSDFELIIVDDGSSDATINIIRGFRDPRITVVEQKNSGPSIALNNGISKGRGEFIAFMSGDDVSFPNRLMTQIEQIELQQADILFCLPQIIGPDSKILSNNTLREFFNRDFETTADLYSQLFYSPNFLCAPSCFCRRAALEKVGRFKRGLIQLQDFDYWIRACKKNLVIILSRDTLVKYRYLFGGNLSDYRNANRTMTEMTAIYRGFFDDAPADLLLKAFGEKITRGVLDGSPDLEIDKSFLFLSHSTASVREIGMERMIKQFEDGEHYRKLKVERNFDTAEFFQIEKTGKPVVLGVIGNLKKNIFRFFRNFFFLYFPLFISEGSRWTEAQVEARMRFYLDRGENKKAIMVAHGIRRIPPGPAIFATLLNLFDRIFKKGIRIFRVAFGELQTTHYPGPGMEGVFQVCRMYDYSKETNCLVYEEVTAKINLKKPDVLGKFTGELYEGEADLPRIYVSIIDHAIITGGSNLVITQSGRLLSDEMVDFPSKDFGIKSPYINYRQDARVILAYKTKPNIQIKEGILLSCDHDNNYFHWLVECLPKLAFIDALQQFKDAPLLIPSELHENLLEALRRVNINEHPVIRLESGIAYHVERLIFPSALSRVLDRYKGLPVFDADIVLSHRWVSMVAGFLKNNKQPEKKPWRKLYLTRRKGLRVLGNWEEIEALVSVHGFEIIDLDGASLDFQIELFSQASVVVAPTGAALTNMLLCQPGTKVIIFMSNHEATNYYFWSNLSAVTNLDVTIIAGERLFNLTNYWSVHDDYVIDAKLVLEEIKK